MKKFNYILLSSLIVSTAMTACNDDDKSELEIPAPIKVTNGSGTNTTNPDNPNPPSTEEYKEIANTKADFIYGCDPSWVTLMEQKDIKFYNSEGKETECLELLKTIGFNAARFRVWVNPSSEEGINGLCNIDDVIEKCKRAKAQGMKIMIDFHYSDTWADPSKQFKPAAWDNLSQDELANKVYSYTKESLEKIKNAGINVTWVQIGNETKTGMMTKQSDKTTEATNANGGLSNTNGNFAILCNQANKAAKEVFLACKTVVHIQNGQIESDAVYAAKLLKQHNANYDILGVSLYPDFKVSNWYSTYIDECIKNLNTIAQECDKDVMVCELGTEYIATWDGQRAIINSVLRMREEVSRCLGVFYWEPEAYNSFNKYNKGGFLASGKPADALKVFSGNYNYLLPENDPNANADADVLHIAARTGEELGTLEKQEDGTYSGTLTGIKANLEFTVTDKDGNKYGPINWNKPTAGETASMQKAAGDYDHFWFWATADGNYDYTLTFDIKNLTYKYTSNE